MIHTGQFYLILNEDEINYIQRKYNENINLINEKINNEYKEIGISVSFYTRYRKCYMFLTVDFIKLINKNDISEEDYCLIDNTIKEVLGMLFGYALEMTLIRIDYRLDIKIENENDKKFILKAIDKFKCKYRFKKKFNKYDSCKYFNSKSVQFKVYDKVKERKEKGERIEEYEKDVLRFEIALRNRHLNYKKNKKGFTKELKTYLNNDFYLDYFKEIFDGIFYYGDFMKIYVADRILNESTLKKKDKEELREFLIDLTKKNNVDKVLLIANENGEKKYSDYKYKKIINLLNSMNINPVLIPKNLKGTSSIIKNPFKTLIKN
ncbi:phage/plasmid replication domain-containing protein [Clostridium perfringens]|uniref:phage/plasmid replication domain-containing protein n=2 Tax=Clostridium perfringens TaxID=1502 RepID=UPI00115AE625|nr:phage/plasmid replication protein [Clostridium perfringens]MDK0647859.1 hypothetical protein [Clostridium perfringens]MDK0910778.1 hypothetical protein [Clostridium perfringens]MDM0977414.1 hypothetical protein [Clostridium perfringens]MDU2323608.1 phage/plasmid replication protein [Clostridium perfringens]MDU6175263.1 phage/plasmid replication protein [Clostridium perfringens]